MPDRSKQVTLRRSCQACIKGKRRCDQGWPQCSRCLGKDINCEYVNAPLTITSSGRYVGLNRSIVNVTPTPQIHAPLQLEIAKEYDPNIIQFLVAGLRDLPVNFAETGKTIFIHPDLYPNGLPTAVREVHNICRLNMQTGRVNVILLSMLQQYSADLCHRLSHAATFEELLACSQALVLIQCMLVLNEDGNTSPYSEAISAMLAGIAGKLWQQAPIQLPRTLSPRCAWLLAESVRRTIIVCFMLRSAYSLNTRNYSVRTPFIDSLPFDLRTNLWDENSETAWQDALSDSEGSMVSLHEWSNGLAAGRVHDVSGFSGLILAACKGQAVFSIPSPPVNFYIDS
ncbi:hypothetical protein N7516_002366 [Penicillium verrucosum]|uniref:uncharacterized protein n=1 Tax=Penicillium verrucosum TaxID=60171 RepID=UPI0025458E2D|nr:uncharacterized protein N7516_002366 [Penicillium verrucosum]KAJ5942198.1 hypothetical protein N7516_002366 [Penicillium verrucosum]